MNYYSLSERELLIESIEPVTVNGLDVTLFRGGTVIAGRKPGGLPTEPVLLVEVTPTSDQPQGLCALDITYRSVDGWRTGRQRDGGLYRVVVNEDPDVHWPEEELLSACSR